MQEPLDLTNTAAALERSLLLEALARRVTEKRRRAKKDLAYHNLQAFTEFTKADYKADRFHTFFCRILERFLERCIRGEQPRIAISAPPQHGKSELVSRRFPTWAIGKYPSLRFICASYNSTLAQELADHRLAIMASEEYQELFPTLTLTKRRTDLIRTSAGGHMIAAGADQGITGRSSDIGVIDDPIKGHAEAVSETIREKLWNWYRTDFYTRLQQGAGILYTATRWHEDDLQGRLLELMKIGGDQWEVYNFPAIADHDPSKGESDLLEREPGQALAPQRYNEKSLEGRKLVLGTYAFGALFQGRPAPAEGLMLRRTFWRYYRKALLPNFEMVVLSLDAAFKDATDSDHVSCQLWGFVGPKGYLLARTCDRMGYTGTKAECKRLALTLEWKATVLLIEDKANGPAIIEELSREIGGAVRVIPINPSGGKLARAWPFSADLESGNALLPEIEEQPWSGEIVEYAARFPATAMDHDIDAMTQVFNWRRENMHGLLAYYQKEAESQMAHLNRNTPQSLAKVEIPTEKRTCPQCSSPAVIEQPGPDNTSCQCNQCGHAWTLSSPDSSSPVRSSHWGL